MMPIDNFSGEQPAVFAKMPCLSDLSQIINHFGSGIFAMSAEPIVRVAGLILMMAFGIGWTEHAKANDMPPCYAQVCDEGQAYAATVAYAYADNCAWMYRCTITGRNVMRADPSRFTYVLEYFEGMNNTSGGIAGHTWYYDNTKTCAVRPDSAMSGTPVGGKSCLDGCEYQVQSGDLLRATGAVCAAPSPIPDLGKNNCCESDAGAVTAGNPVNIHTGIKLETETDYVAPNGKLELRRYYTSADGLIIRSLLGAPWRHTYSRLLRFANADTVIAARQTGDFHVYRKTGGVWNADVDVQYRLEQQLDPAGATIGWKLRLADDAVESYDTDGNLIRIEWPNGEYVTLGYSYGELVTVIDDQGRTLTFLPDWGKLAGVKLPDGRQIVYGYEYGIGLATVHLKDVDGSLQLRSRYGFTNGASPLLLTQRYDESDSLYASWEYDSSRRVVRSVHGDPSGSVDQVTFVYGPTSTQVTDALGHAVTVERAVLHGRAKSGSFSAPCPSCNGRTFASQTYDVNGYPDTQVDFNGNIIDADYTAAGLMVKKVEAANTNDGSKRTTETTWHPNFRQPIQRDTLDSNNVLKRRQSWTYNIRGQTLSSTLSDPVTSNSRTTTFSYCEASDVTASLCPREGLLLSVDGPLAGTADRTTYQYRAADDSSCASTPTTCPYRKGDLWKVINALGQVTETLKYDGAGRVLSSKDANGVVTDLEYHPRGWLTASKVRGPDDAVETDDVITRIEYWPTGLVKRVTQPDGAYTQYAYDQAHRLTDVTDNAGNLIHYTLDNAGNRTAEKTKDNSGNLKRSLSRVYNQLGQLTTQSDAYANATEFTYTANGDVETTIDPLDHVTGNAYDALNRLAQTLQDVGGIEATTAFEYDALDNLVKVIDPKGLHTTYSQNGLGDLTQLSSPDTGVTAYTYDAAGNRKTQTDARGVTATYSYDVLGRLTAIAYPTSSLDVGYTYDAVQSACVAGETFSAGYLTRINDASGQTQYCYDRFGRLTRKVQTTNGIAFTVRYQWSKAGQLLGMVYPDGSEVDYSRNALGQITAIGVTRPGQAREVLLQQASHHPFGPVAGWTYGNGRTMVRALDQNYRPVRIEDNGADGLSLGFGYDASGNLTALGNASGVTAPEVTFDYDALGRLTRTEDGPTQIAIDAYAYDATGNRLSHTTAAGTSIYSYPTTNHRLTDVGGTARSYDSVGNTTTIGAGREFVYSDANRMSQVKNGGAVAMNYAYNGRGEQVRRHIGTTNTYTVYDEAGHWLGDYDSAGTTIQQALWMDDLPVGLQANGGQLHYIEPDHLGSPRVVIEVARDVAVWEWSLKGEVFGSTEPNDDPDSNAVFQSVDMRFPGQRYDTVLGLNQNGFRDGYDSGSGRYTQSDPIGQIGGISTYAYVESNPLSMIDLFGLQSSMAARGAVAAYRPYYINSSNGIGQDMVLTQSSTDWSLPQEQSKPEPTVTEPVGQVVGDFLLARILKPMRMLEQLVANTAISMCEAEDREKREHNCQAPRLSILDACASLSGSKRSKCIVVAQDSYDQCMQD